MGFKRRLSVRLRRGPRRQTAGRRQTACGRSLQSSALHHGQRCSLCICARSRFSGGAGVPRHYRDPPRSARSAQAHRSLPPLPSLHVTGFVHDAPWRACMGASEAVLCVSRVLTPDSVTLRAA